MPTSGTAAVSSAAASPSASPARQGVITPGGPGGVVQQKQPLRWTQIVLGAGVAAGGAYVAKKAFEGYATKLFHYVVDSTSGKEDSSSADENKRVDAIVSDLKAQTTELQNSVDSLKQMFVSLEGSVSDYKSATGNQEDVSELRDELRSLASTINQFASPEKQAYEETLKDELSAIKSILSDITHTPQQPQRTEDFENPPSQRTISDLLNAEVVGSSSKQVNDMGGAYNQVRSTPQSYQSELDYPSSSKGKGKQKKEYVRESPYGSEITPQPPYPSELETPSSSKVQEKDFNTDPPRPPSYMEILEMLEKNQTPPGIRTDIDDKAKGPITEVQISEAPLKPWQRSSSESKDIGEASGWRPPARPMSRIVK